MNPELITKLVEAIVTVVVVLISAYVIPWLKNKIGEDKYTTLVEFAEIVVRSAEKIYTQEEWQTKKNYAVELVISKSKELGLELSIEEINAIIEGAVQAVKG
mgnify:CR=1 FL=1